MQHTTLLEDVGTVTQSLRLTTTYEKGSYLVFDPGHSSASMWNGVHLHMASVWDA